MDLTKYNIRMDRLIDIVLKNDYESNLQIVRTPFKLIKEMVEKVNIKDGEKILVLFNLEIVYILIRDYKINPSNIYYTSDNIPKQKLANTILKVNIFDYSLIDINNKKETKKETTMDMMKMTIKNGETYIEDIFITKSKGNISPLGKKLNKAGIYTMDQLLTTDLNSINPKITEGQLKTINEIKDEYVNKLEEGNGNNSSTGPKFDVIIGNPPYLRNLHLKFLEECYDMGNKIVFIHPSSWIIAKNNNSTYEKIKTKLNGLKSIKFIKGDYYFNAEFKSPIMITNIDKEYVGDITITDEIYGNDYSTSDINNVSFVHNYENKLFNSIKDKIENHNKFNNEYKDYYTLISYIMGHIANVGGKKEDHKFKFFGNDFFLYSTPKDDKEVNKSPFDNSSKKYPYYFNTKDECLNFKETLKLKLMKLNLSLYKIDANIKPYHLENIPDLDYSISWTDEDLYKEYNLTEEEIEYVENWIDKIIK